MPELVVPGPAERRTGRVVVVVGALHPDPVGEQAENKLTRKNAQGSTEGCRNLPIRDPGVLPRVI